MQVFLSSFSAGLEAGGKQTVKSRKTFCQHFSKWPLGRWPLFSVTDELTRYQGRAVSSLERGPWRRLVSHRRGQSTPPMEKGTLNGTQSLLPLTYGSSQTPCLWAVLVGLQSRGIKILLIPRVCFQFLGYPGLRIWHYQSDRTLCLFAELLKGSNAVVLL